MRCQLLDFPSMLLPDGSGTFKKLPNGNLLVKK
nr:MAG TPA: hypothetical protein [Caudoviricetes sp.]